MPEPPRNDLLSHKRNTQPRLQGRTLPPPPPPFLRSFVHVPESTQVPTTPLLCPASCLGSPPAGTGIDRDGSEVEGHVVPWHRAAGMALALPPASGAEGGEGTSDARAEIG